MICFFISPQHYAPKNSAKHYPEVKIISVCDDPQKGVSAIDTLKPDLVFHDIEMPLINGFTLLQQLVGFYVSMCLCGSYIPANFFS